MGPELSALAPSSMATLVIHLPTKRGHVAPDHANGHLTHDIPFGSFERCICQFLPSLCFAFEVRNQHPFGDLIERQETRQVQPRPL
jgi:hypothetical protein